MAEYTANLNLLKKDPATDGNDTFNIKTMLNDNWDKIDDFAKFIENELSNVDDVETSVSNLIQQIGTLEELDTETKLNLVAAINELSNKKVDKVTGKGLSTNDYTDEEKQKLAGIEEGANKYVHPKTHSANIITENENRRFVSDEEKAEWNAKETPEGAQAKVDALAGEGNIKTVKQLDDDLAAHKAEDTTNAHSPKNVGLGNVTNDKQMPIAGGTFTGIAKAHNNTSYTVAQIRNIILSPNEPSGGNNGDIWIKYS